MEEPIGRLKHPATGRVIELRTRHLVGRAPGADLRLELPHVSSHHAELCWDGLAWSLRDLGSRNGTFLGAQRLPAGEPIQLMMGARLDFGSPMAGWELVCPDPPQPMARTLRGEQVVLAIQGRLEIPGDPGVRIVQAAEGWRLHKDRSTPVEDGEILMVAGREWLLCLPRPVLATVPTPDEARSAVHLAFVVSLDEEHVEVNLSQGDLRARLKPRAHLYTLVILARQRLADQLDPDLPEAEHGWMQQTELCRMLGIDANLLYIHLHRFRKQVLDAGVEQDPIERRIDSGQLRLGTPFLRVDRG